MMQMDQFKILCDMFKCLYVQKKLPAMCTLALMHSATRPYSKDSLTGFYIYSF